MIFDYKIVIILVRKLILLVMNIRDETVLEMLNNLIAVNRLSRNQILKIVELVSVSNDIGELKENFEWEKL